MNTTGQIGSISSPIVAAWLVDHYANYARTELEEFGSVVTDWELRRGFERL